MSSLKKIIFSLKILLRRAKAIWPRFFIQRNSFKKHKEAQIRPKQVKLDKKLVFSLTKSRIPNPRQFKYLKNFLSPRELWLLRSGILMVVAGAIWWATVFYVHNRQVVPIVGGEYVEGLIGIPKHINPLYASVNDADNDISRLVYSSLFKRGKNGELVNDLVESYQISSDQKIYTFTLRPQVKWHDGHSLTADDIVFTFNALTNSQYKSPLRTSFGGIRIEKIDQRQFKFILDSPYAAFLELLTFGILPAHLWSQIPVESANLAELNLKPIGSGPFVFVNFLKDKQGEIKEYNLTPNKDYYGQVPLVNLKFMFFPDFTAAMAALNDNVVDGISYLPPEMKGDILRPQTYNFHKLFLPQLTLIFFNQAHNKFLADKAVRQALAFAIDRNAIVNNILDGNAYLVDGPILPNSFAYYQDIKKYTYNLKEADRLLLNIDWKLVDVTEEDVAQAREEVNSEDEEMKKKAEAILAVGPGRWRQKKGQFLVVNLKTVDRRENKRVVEAVRDYWEKIGVKTIVDVLPAVQLRQKVIKPRNFDALFYGLVTGADPDPYAFWHSSQAGVNGFNIADFVNKEADQLLEDARITSDIKARQEKYKKFQEIIAEQEPAIFMYSPIYIYPQSVKVKGFAVKNIIFPRDRFANIEEWYIKTGKKLIWPKK